jgi:hypothetical protein
VGYGQEISSISVWDRPYNLRCASSIAAADWDTCRIPFTTKTSYAKRNRDDPVCRERHITVSSRIACAFAETKTWPQKGND